MPVEIRELIIKTEISATSQRTQGGVKAEQINTLKRQLLEEVKQMIFEKTKKNSYKR